MGNRGTTPSWDDEQIAKYGLFAHFNMVNAPYRAEKARRDAELVKAHIESVLAHLPNASEETKVRAALAIPRVLSMIHMVKHNSHLLAPYWRERWREGLAREIYEIEFDRSRQLGPRAHFNLLPSDEQGVFLEIIDAVVRSQKEQLTASP